jgi:hypothetical protein
LFHANTGKNWRLPSKEEVLESFTNGLYDVLTPEDRRQPKSFYWFTQDNVQGTMVFDSGSGNFSTWHGEARARCVGEAD